MLSSYILKTKYHENKKRLSDRETEIDLPVSSFDANKKYALNFEYSFDGAIIRKDTGYRVRVKDWNKDGNEKKGALRSSYGADYISDNSKLITTLFRYDSEITAYVLKYPGMLSKRIIQAILNGVPVTRDDDGLDLQCHHQPQPYSDHSCLRTCPR